MPGSAVFMPRAGMASAMRMPPLTIAETSGRLSTRSTTRDHRPNSAVRRLRRWTSGTRPRSILSPIIDSSAGSTVIEPSIATATTRMPPVANDMNVGSLDRYMPAIAIITVKPETSTARPEVAAAASIAASLLRPGSAFLALAPQVEQRVVDADGEADEQDDLVDLARDRRTAC